MAGYDDDRIASDKEAEAMNDEYAVINAAKGRRRAEGILPVYLTDEAHRAAECCFAAAEGCVYLLDYATTPDEKRLLRYAADEMKGLSSALGGGRKISSSEQFGTVGVKRALCKTALLCNEAAIKINALARAAGEDVYFYLKANAATVATESVALVYLMQI